MPPTDVPIPEGESAPGQTAGGVPIPEGEEGHVNFHPDFGGRSTKLGEAAIEPRRMSTLEATGRGLVADAISLGNLISNIPAGLVGVAEDVGMRVYGATHGMSHKESSQLGNLGFQVAIEKYGNWVSKLIDYAGLGKDDDAPQGQSRVDEVMNRASSLIGKGGEWMEKHTNGVMNKEDVETYANVLMSLGGAKGLKGGLEKTAKVAADRFGPGMMKTPAVEEAQARASAILSDDPQAASKMADEGVEKAVAAKKGKLTEAKNLVLNPVTGSLHEAVPEPGQPLPKPSSLESALEKVSNSRRFDMTAEERIAYRDWEKQPPPQELVDEQGKPNPNATIALGQSYRPKSSMDIRTPREQIADEASTHLGEGEEPYLGEQYEGMERGSGSRSSTRYKGGRQTGSIDPKMMARLAGLGLGAWAGLYFSDDKSLMAALAGGGIGLAMASASPKRAAAFIKEGFSKDTRLNVNDIGDWMEKFVKLAAADTFSVQKRAEVFAPDNASMERVHNAIDQGNVDKLTPNEQKAAAIFQKGYKEWAEVGQREGVLDEVRDNYVSHFWDWTKNKGLIAQWLDQSRTLFQKTRTYPTIAMGKAAGLTPLTEDASVAYGMYANHMAMAIAKKIYLRALGAKVDPATGKPLVMDAADAPHSYVPINNPSFVGKSVHPDIAPGVKMLFDTSSPGAVMKVMQGISDTSKRSQVALSGFHMMSLVQALLAGASHPIKAFSHLPGIIRGTDEFLQELKKGSASQLVQDAAEGGLMYSFEHTAPAVEDTGAGFYQSMKAVQGTLDRVLPGAGKPIAGLIRFNHAFDNVMWARMHTGMKLLIFSEKRDALLRNSAKGDPRYALTREEANRTAASYTNDLFGGLNWRRIADDAMSKFGRDLGHATLNPEARRGLQLLMFAPDWTISTTRALVQGFVHKGSGPRGLVGARTLADLHRQYLLRSAMYYVIIGDAINHALSGHHFWQNKDWTVIDLDPNGDRHLQLSKHFMEPFHWLKNPGQQAINKLGFIPKESLEQGLGVEYLSAKGRMPPMKNRLKHLAQNFVPISARQGGISGALGVPIYGKTKAEREEEKRAAERQRRHEHKHKHGKKTED